MISRTFVCPICNQSVKDLEGHKKRKHPEKPASEAISEAVTSSAEKQELETLILPQIHEEKPENKYHCVDCGHAFNEKLETCPKCGCKFDWEGITA